MSKVKQAIEIMLFESDEFGGPKIVGGGICPTQRANKTCCGVIEVMETEQKIGNIFGFTGGNYAGNVYDKDHLSPTLNTMQGGCKQPMIIDDVIIGGMQEHQSVKKDCICTCLTSSMGTGGGYVPMIPETVRIKQATKQGYIECDVGGVADLSFPDSNTRIGRVQDNGKTCQTLTAESQDICKIEKVGQISNDGSQYGTVIADNGLSSNLVAGTHGYANSCIATQYRIRKLTPRECWRLMDFSDEDFEKAEEVNSNTQLYKQAGNSIVKNVLIAIFGQMISGKCMCYLRKE